MSAEEQSGGRGRLTRRQFLALGVAGASALAFGGVAFGQQTGEEEQYKGHRIKVERRNGSKELYIDGERVDMYDSSGIYRAADHAFDWGETPSELAKKIINARRAYAARGVRKGLIL